MWPWAHAAVGYLLYTLSLERRDSLPPSAAPALAAGMGAITPDLVDKPFAWYLDVLPTGRSLTHSLVVLVPVALGIVWLLGRRDHAETGYAFSIGLVSHPLADGLHALVAGEWADLSYLAWPILRSPEYSGPESIVARLRLLEVTPFFTFELLLTGLAVALWMRHGCPGIGMLRSWGRAAVT